MPQENVSMRKVKEVLRLRFGLGLQQNQIARSCSIGQATVHRYLQKAAAADHSSLIIYTIVISSILYFQRNTTGASLISSKY